MTGQVEETLAREAAERPRAAIIAIVAGVLTLVGNVAAALIFGGGPSEKDGFISLPEAFQARLIDNQPPQGPSLVSRQVQYFGDHVVTLTLSSLLTAAAAVLAGLTLLFLYRATAARNPQVGKVPFYAIVAALIFFPLGHVLREVPGWIGAASFDGGTARQARDALGTTTGAIGSVAEFLGLFAFALSFVLVGLNAMRVGLLTRFLGVLAIIVGVLTIFQIDQPQIVKAFWLVAVGLLFLGRSAIGFGGGRQPPAWETGRAEPWPSQQQIREQREALKRGDATPPEPDEPSGENGGDVAVAQRTQQQKRKRKRRR